MPLRILGLDLVVRDEAGNMLEPDLTSTISLFRAHETASRSVDDRIQEEKVPLGLSPSWLTLAGVCQRRLCPPQMRLQNREMRCQSLFSTVHTYSLFMNLKNFVCNIGEDAELLMSLYDPDQSEFIRSDRRLTPRRLLLLKAGLMGVLLPYSENFLVRWDSMGMPKEIEKLNNLPALFTVSESQPPFHCPGRARYWRPRLFSINFSFSLSSH